MTSQKQAPPSASLPERLTGALAVLSWASLLGYYFVLRPLLSPEKERLGILVYYGISALGSLAAALAVWGIVGLFNRPAKEGAKPPSARIYILVSAGLFYGGVRVMQALGQEDGLLWTTLTPLFCTGMALYFCRRYGWHPGLVFYFALLVSVAHFHAVWIAIEVHTSLEKWQTAFAGQTLDLALVAAGLCAGAAGAGLSLLGLWWLGGGFRSPGAIAVSMLVLGVVGAVGLPLAIDVDKGVTWFYAGLFLYVPWQAVFGVALTKLHAGRRPAPQEARAQQYTEPPPN